MKVACIQMCSGIDPDINLDNAEQWLAEAAGQGVELAVFSGGGTGAAGLLRTLLFADTHREDVAVGAVQYAVRG